MITGVDNPEEGKQLIEEMTSLTDSAGFTLRKWNSNCEAVLSDLQPHLRDERTVLEMDSPPPTATVKTLGLVWCPNSDDFNFTVPKWSSTSIVTKRIVISDASKLFDPLGLVGPVVVEAKIFIQTLWKLQVSWDEPLPENLQTLWLEYRRNLSSLESICIPRWVGYSESCTSFEWHGFCDASDSAYGACLYLRSTSHDGTVRVQLMMSKSRVAPLEDLKKKKRKLSTPRLELSSALLPSHLYEKVNQATQLAIPSFFWTDSNIVKFWIASIPSRWQTFVANRVSEIQHLTRGGVWNHVAGIENPADVLSRGISAAQLEYQSLWFNGPVWLHQGRNFWPEESAVTVEQLDPASLEERKTVALPLQAIPPSEIFSLRSSLSSLVRLVAWIRRFRHNTQRTNQNFKKTGFISSQEYEDALLQLVRLSQVECFPQEIASLSREDQVKEGRPALIMCDNAKNFVGAKRELRQLLNLFEQQQFQNAVACNAAAEQIEFKFIPARSPNFGGLWEAAVKSFKITFKKIIGTRTLLYDEMQTVLTQVEAVLNSRPLTPISNDPGDFEALTPGTF